LRVVVVVHDLGGTRGRRREGAIPALAVGDAPTDECRHCHREHPVAGATLGPHLEDGPGEARPDDVVRGPVEDRGDEPLELLGRVLAVGIAEGDRDRVEGGGRGQTRPHG
jgi:hypothetical protein